MPRPATADHRRPVRPYGGVSAEARVAERRERFIQAGLQEFGTRGVQATGVKDICAKAHLTDRYFYESFSDSRALFIAVFDRATSHLFDTTARALSTAPPTAPQQTHAVIEAYVRALADDPRIARVVFVEAPSAGPEVEQHMRTTLRTFARLVETTARQHLPPSVTDDALRFGAIALVGAIERLMIEWQDGELGLTIDQVVGYLVDLILGAGQAAAIRSEELSRRGKGKGSGTGKGKGNGESQSERRQTG
jgi:AcrR family transcriptional regulator